MDLTILMLIMITISYLLNTKEYFTRYPRYSKHMYLQLSGYYVIIVLLLFQKILN